jgi:hypothetical protein
VLAWTLPHRCRVRGKHRLADVNALDPPTERVRADRMGERTTDVHAGAPVGQPLPRHVPGDVNVDLSPGPCWSHRHHRADGATSRAITMAVLDGPSQRFTRRRIGGPKRPTPPNRANADLRSVAQSVFGQFRGFMRLGCTLGGSPGIFG